MARILITGGAGFIGSHLADRLLADGHSVLALDNLFTGHTRNISHLVGHERFQFIKHDVTEYVYVEGQLDAILHLASLPSPVDYLREPIKTLKVGALGTHKALGLARAHHAKFLLASTSEAAGERRGFPEPKRAVKEYQDRADHAAGGKDRRFRQIGQPRIFNEPVRDGRKGIGPFVSGEYDSGC